jgi:trk system potassium uptake protein TrkH
MFIGASPGSTGGGVKTTTIGVIFFFLKSKITGRESVNLFYRTLPIEIVIKAFTVVSLAFGIIFISTLALFIIESSFPFESILFEVFSAFGTVGLSLGITPHLSTLGKVIIIITMYVGRIGPLTLLFALGRERAKGKFEYIEEKVMIG